MSFEGGGKDGSLRLATSGIGAAYLEVQGKSVHAGVKPEAGINALTERIVTSNLTVTRFIES